MMTMIGKAVFGQSVMDAYRQWQATYVPTVAVPEKSTEAYANGWKFGDWWLSQGGSSTDTSDTPDTWGEERANGFWDRLAHARAAAILAA